MRSKARRAAKFTSMRKLNINQLCSALGVSRRTVYRWVERKILPQPHKGRSGVLWDAHEVREFAARRHRLLLA